MKKLGILTIFIIAVLATTALSYIVITIDPWELELMPGNSDTITATVTSDELYDITILCDIDKYDSGGSYLETITNGASDCGGTPEIIIELSGGGVIIEDEVGDESGIDYGIDISLSPSVDDTYTYRYTVGALGDYTVGAVTADVNTIPEFSAITAGIALGGAGLAFWRLRRRK